MTDQTENRPAFRQTGQGVISAEGWDSFSRLTALGLSETPKPKSAPPPFFQSGKGVISATPFETPDEKPEIDPVPIEQADLISGVVAAGISLNALRPLQPFPSTWDAFSSPVAILDGSLAAFRLPDPAPVINDYIAGETGVEYDEACLLSDESPTRQRLPNAGMHNSYMLGATAIFRDIEIDALSVITSAAAASGVVVDHAGWAGIHAYGDPLTATLSIAAHHIPNAGVITHHAEGGGSPSVTMTPPDPDPVSSIQTAVFDLLFYAIAGGTWHLIITRTS
jgi:hypothetical protein